MVANDLAVVTGLSGTVSAARSTDSCSPAEPSETALSMDSLDASCPTAGPLSSSFRLLSSCLLSDW